MVSSMRLSPTGSHLAVGYQNGSIKLWNVVTGVVDITLKFVHHYVYNSVVPLVEDMLDVKFSLTYSCLMFFPWMFLVLFRSLTVV
jgi:hypothetical protein